MLLSDFPLLKKRFIQFLRIGQVTSAIIMGIAIFNDLMNGEVVTSQAIFKYVAIVAFPSFIIFLVKREMVLLAANIFLTVRISALLGEMWAQGGLMSAIITVLPWMLFFSAIYTSSRVHLFYVATLLSVTLAFGLNDIHQWGHSSAVQLVDDNVRFAQLSLIFLVSGIFSLTMARDLRFVYHESKKENLRARKASNRFQRLADNDQLTNLNNRYGARRKFEKLSSRTDFSSECILFLFVDIDDFKSINNQYGHQIGDELLYKFGQRLKKVAEKSAIVSRLGGDEFVVAIKQNLDFNNTNSIEAFFEELSKPYTVKGASGIDVTASIGAVISKSAEQSFDGLCGMADMAMYKVKEDGKNHFHYYNDNLKQAYMGNLSILQGMQKAIDDGGLALSYQAKLDTSTGEVVGVEALLRWEENNPGAYKVDQIIPVLETTNLIHDVGYWVIKEACRTGQSWHLLGKEFPISVNVSAQQLTRQDFAGNVSKILNETGLPASSLMLEIKEDSLISEVDEVMTQLREIKAIGIKLSIDGFGSGYSSMTYLAELQVDELKLDKSFASKVSSNDKTRLVVSAFINMANKLGVNLVAHGIETDKDRGILRDLGCKVGQGFLWGKPVPAKELALTPVSI